mgnify:CR=1 FL=1
MNYKRFSFYGTNRFLMHFYTMTLKVVKYLASIVYNISNKKWLEQQNTPISFPQNHVTLATL